VSTVLNYPWSRSTIVRSRFDPLPTPQLVWLMHCTFHPLIIARGVYDTLAPPAMDPHYYEDNFGGCTWTLLPLKVVCIRHEAQADEEIVAWVKQHTNLIAHLPLSTFPDFHFSTSIVHPSRLLTFFCLGSDTSGACLMLPRDKVGVVDPWPRSVKRIHANFKKCCPHRPAFCLLTSVPAYCGGLTIFRRCTGRTTCASSITGAPTQSTSCFFHSVACADIWPVDSVRIWLG